MQHLNGLLKPKSGTIVVGDTDITADGVVMRDIRKKIGLVFQYPEYQLFEETVAQGTWPSARQTWDFHRRR